MKGRTMFFWLKQILDPEYVTRLCNKLGNINAIKEFINVWPRRIMIPDEMIERLTFEECRMLLEQFSIGHEIDIHQRTQTNAINRRAIQTAKTFEQFEYVASQFHSKDDVTDISSACIRMAETASSFEECIKALKMLESEGIKSISANGDRCKKDELVIQAFRYARKSSDYAELAAYSLSSRHIFAARMHATHTANTAGDLLRIYKLNPDEYVPLYRALYLRGTADEFLEIALLMKGASDIKLAMIDKARTAYGEVLELMVPSQSCR